MVEVGAFEQDISLIHFRNMPRIGEHEATGLQAQFGARSCEYRPLDLRLQHGLLRPQGSSSEPKNMESFNICLTGMGSPFISLLQ